VAAQVGARQEGVSTMKLVIPLLPPHMSSWHCVRVVLQSDILTFTLPAQLPSW
jgi:hypothetical protein